MALLRTGVGSRETLLGVTSFMERLHLFSVEMKGGWKDGSAGKVLASCQPQVQSTQWKERTDYSRLFSDLHIYPMTYVPSNIHRNRS